MSQAATVENDLGARLRSAARLEPARLPRLRLIGAQWSEHLASAIGREFEAPVTIEPLETRTVGAGEAAIREAAVLAEISSPGWPAPAFAVADEAFCSLAAECFFGGDGSGIPLPTRAPSALDREMCRTAFDRLLEAGNLVLAPVLAATMRTGRLTTGDVADHLAAIAPDADARFVEFAFRFAIGRCESVVRVLVPDAVLAVHRRKLDRVPDPVPVEVDDGWSREIESGLLEADMALTALLDEKQISLGEIGRFRLGQTIVLGTRVDSLITIECEDQRLFRGRMGRSRDSYLVRIEEKVDPTEEFIDDILAD